MRNAPDTPQSIHLETPHFVLRDIEPDEVQPRWGTWLADPVKARMINAPPRALDLDTFRKYAAGHDRRSGHLLGIFAKSTGEMVGFWSFYIDWERSEFLVSVLVGERGRLSRFAREETQVALLDHAFDTLALETLRCSALARNTYVTQKLLLECGATREHTSYNPPAAAGQAFVEIGHYRASRDVWRKVRAKMLAHAHARAVAD